MVTKLNFILFLAYFIWSFNDSSAQILEIDADVRARFEYRHGYNTLFPDEADPAAFVNQRTRLNFGYYSENLQLFIALQDVSVWGDTRQILPIDGNDSFSIFQAYIQLQFDKNWAVKLGRQVITYDDERIFGGLDWAMQGRFHDAAIVKYKKNGLQVDLGGAFSQDNAKNEGTIYLTQGAHTYKSMQFVHLKKNWRNFQGSLLLLNNGFQNFSGADNDISDGVYNMQTVGTYLEFPFGKINFFGSGYYQFGKADATTDLSAYELAFAGNYKTKKMLYGLGVEILSGTNQDESSENNSFFPLYGTSHKFNGFMDYFYVGNHANNVGLNDLFGKLVYTIGEKSDILLKVHRFMSNAALANNADRYLGTEIDFVYAQKLMPYVKLNVGYSQMFAAESMSLIKNGRTHDNLNNWGWIQLTVNPRLFSSELNKPQK
ncbi:MAG TPA: alginate export family protein [Flavobacteriaceae bacterium]|nr:alginate export family protein [Flavobacteriaceae bacterium]